jgi:hypothetical protein
MRSRGSRPLREPHERIRSATSTPRTSHEYHRQMEAIPPLILLEGTDGPQEGPPHGGDPRLFGTIEELIAAVEGPDVRAGIVQAFDAGGRRLRLRVDTDTSAVTASLDPQEYPDALRDVLAGAIRSSPHLYPSMSPDRPLNELVAALWRVEEAARADRRMKRLTLYRQVGLWILLMGVLVVAQPPVLQPRPEVSTLILVGIWLVVAIGAYWLAGRLLVLFSPNSFSDRR